MLEAVLADRGIDAGALDPALLAEWADAWHRLDAWPEAGAALARLRRVAPCVTLSNGNLALQVDLARHAGLTWDAHCGGDVARAYKPDPAAYRAAAAALRCLPGELCLVAAHHSDLAAARSCGLATAYIHRPDEYGGRHAPDADAAQQWDWQASDLGDLADQLGAA